MIPENRRTRAIAVQWGLGKAKTGAEQIAVVFDLLDLPGQQITWYGYFTDRAIERTIESLRHCGWTCNRIDRLEGMGSQEVSLSIEHKDDGRGGVRPEVRWVNKGGIVAAPLEGNDLQSLVARVQRSAGGKPAAQQPLPSHQPPPNDDIPF